MGEPIRVVITGAAGQIAYSLLYSVAKGDVFGADQNIILVLLDLEFMKEVMNGVVMELNDCAFPLVQKIIATADYEEAFTGADACMLVGAMPRKQGMERKDLLAANVKIFKGQGMSIDKYAKKTVKIVVVGNPANTNALICSKYAPSIPKENFSALTRLDQNRAKSQIGNRLGINSSAVSNVIIWGNHSSTQYPDVEHATVVVGSESASVGEKVQNDAWLKNDFVSTVQKRGAAVIAARKLSSAMSAAKATADHMKDWWCGTKGDEWTSMAVISDGNSYGIPAGLMYSFPVRIADHKWTIVDGLKISDFSRNKMDLTAKELTEERDAALEEVGKE